MRTLVSPLALALLPLSACATVPTRPPAGDVESIVYETGPCFGACPVYRVTVNADGSGLFEGRRFTPVTGERAFRVTPAQFLAFARHLESVRPVSGVVRYAGENCRQIATDMTSVEVTWRAAGAEQQLYFYYGCDLERNEALGAHLIEAPDYLPPVAELLGRPPPDPR